jgi:hypothetical protein
VNNSAVFLLAIGGLTVINGFKLNSMLARPNFPNNRVSFSVVLLIFGIVGFASD